MLEIVEGLDTVVAPTHVSYEGAQPRGRDQEGAQQPKLHKDRARRQHQLLLAACRLVVEGDLPHFQPVKDNWGRRLLVPLVGVVEVT